MKHQPPPTHSNQPVPNTKTYLHFLASVHPNNGLNIFNRVFAHKTVPQYQSIKNASANINGIARLSGVTTAPVFNNKINEECDINRPSSMRATMGEKAKSKRCVLRRFLKLQLRRLNRQIARGCSKGKGHKSEMPLRQC